MVGRGVRHFRVISLLFITRGERQADKGDLIVATRGDRHGCIKGGWNEHVKMLLVAARYHTYRRI